MMTGQGSVESAVEAMRNGAFHYLTKPFHLDEMELQIEKAYERNALARRAQEAPVTHKATRDYTRFLFAGASDETPDKQGRITIPPMLREYASLTRDCVVIGAMNRVEIWDAAAWRSYSEEQESAFADLSEEVLPGVF